MHATNNDPLPNRLNDTPYNWQSDMNSIAHSSTQTPQGEMATSSPLPENSFPSSTKWGPYSTARDLDVNMATVLLALVSAAVLAFCVIGIIRLLVRLWRRLHQPDKHRPNNSPSLADTLPSLIFSPGTQLAGAGPAECAICLTEFIDGDRLKALPACNHGFHDKCVEGWLCNNPSCPTCRTACAPAAPPPELQA